MSFMRFFWLLYFCQTSLRAATSSRVSHIEALVPGQGAPPLPEVHVDIGGDQVVHLVALMAEKKSRR